MSFRIINEVAKLNGKVALVRLDTNVPLSGKKVVDDTRLVEAIPTIRLLQRHGASVILVGHLGRPQGKKVASLSLKPIGYALGKLLRQPVKVLPLSLGAAALRREATRGVVLLENIRFEKGEDKNDAALARRLAQLGDMYVNEAFSVSHRAAASLMAITKYVPSYAGLHLAHEVAALQTVRKSGHKPVVAIIGGVKVADKLPVITKFLPRVDQVLVGGVVGTTFLAASGRRIGQSLVDRALIGEARAVLKRGGHKIILPRDVVVDVIGTRQHEATLVAADRIGPRHKVLDVGTETVRLFASYVRQARTVLWAGTLGQTEQPPYRHGTLALGRLVSARARGRTYVVVGGGDTVAFWHQHQLWADHLSLGGGAMLQFLAGEPLPALAALGFRR